MKVLLNISHVYILSAMRKVRGRKKVSYPYREGIVLLLLHVHALWCHTKCGTISGATLSIFLIFLIFIFKKIMYLVE
jgi:hypothetical protein